MIIKKTLFGFSLEVSTQEVKEIARMKLVDPQFYRSSDILSFVSRMLASYYKKKL